MLHHMVTILNPKWPTMATAAILNLFNPPKAATHYGGYSYKVS
jgi:hypothetical protein